MSFRVAPEDRFPTAATGSKPTEEQITSARLIRNLTVQLATVIDEEVPEGRWKSLALVNLEESLMWANKELFNHKP